MTQIQMLLKHTKEIWTRLQLKARFDRQAAFDTHFGRPSLLVKFVSRLLKIQHSYLKIRFSSYCSHVWSSPWPQFNGALILVSY
jgi:hypothetical protein